MPYNRGSLPISIYQKDGKADFGRYNISLSFFYFSKELMLQYIIYEPGW